MSWKAKNNFGFTLIELLVALGILALLMAILYQTFSAMIAVTEKVEEETEIYRMARLSLSIMTEELRSTYWTQDRATTFFVGTDEEHLGQPADSLTFTALSRHRYGEGSDGPELATLHYFLETASLESSALGGSGGGEEPRLILIHEEETNSLSLSADSRKLTELGEMVWGFNLRYLDRKEWVDSWDAGERKKPPRAVEIRLTFKDKRGQEYQFFTRADIPIAASG